MLSNIPKVIWLVSGRDGFQPGSPGSKVHASNSEELQIISLSEEGAGQKKAGR